MLLFMLVLLHIAVLTLVFCFLLSPQAIFKDPFRGGNNILVRPVILESWFILWYVDWNANIFEINWIFFSAKVICDAYTPQGEPIPTNKRHKAAEIFSNPKVEAEIPWYVY
jgi:glutamine synthetase